MGIPSDLGKMLKCDSVGTCIREILEGESRKINGVCSFNREYM